MELCTVGKMVPGYTKVVLSVVSCSKQMSLYTFCTRKVADSYNQDLINLNTHLHGYSLHSHGKSQILTAKYNCGDFTHMIGHTCLIFIHYNKVCCLSL